MPVTDLAFEVIDSRPEDYAAEPTLVLRLRITNTSGAPVHALALKCQIRIEPQRRQYDATEKERLFDLFGEAPQWGSSLHPFLWTHISTMVTGFDTSTEVDLHVPCSYDMEVAGAKYLHALAGGEIPIVLLFSGSVFGAGSAPSGAGFTARPVAWSAEANHRLPLEIWRATIDRYFPGVGYIKVSHQVLDDLAKFKTDRALPTFDQALERLLKEAGDP